MKLRKFKFLSKVDTFTYYRAFNKKGDIIAVESDLSSLSELIADSGAKAVRFEQMKIHTYTASNGWKAAEKPKKNDLETLSMLGRTFRRARKSYPYGGRIDYSRP